MHVHNSNTNASSSSSKVEEDEHSIYTTSTADTAHTMNTTKQQQHHSSSILNNNNNNKPRRNSGSITTSIKDIENGTHMVDIIDPDAVDFQPLILQDNNNNNNNNTQTKVKVGHYRRSSPHINPNEGTSDNYADSETVPLTDASSISSNTTTTSSSSTYPYNDDSSKKSYSSSSPNFRNFNQKFHQFRYTLLHKYFFPFISTHIEPHLQSPSFSSSLSICLLFFVLIVLFGTIFAFIADHLYIPEHSFFPSLSSSGFSSSVKVISGGQAPPKNTQLPGTIEVFADVDEELDITDTAVFWHVPRSGGTTMKNVMAMCLGRVVATELGGQEGHRMDDTLVIIPKPYGNYVNVDTTTILGLQHAKDLGLAPSRMAEVIFTPYIHETSILFDSNYRGRFFTLLRDPVDRLVSLYYYRQMDQEDIRNTTLLDFASASGDNWHVRMLTGEMTEPVTVHHLNIAKEILRRKFLIGLLDEKTETLRRIETYFGWKFPSPVAQNCKNMKFYFEWNAYNVHPTLDYENKNDQVVLEAISKHNRFDIELYQYAVNLFREQERFFWNGDGEEDGEGLRHRQ